MKVRRWISLVLNIGIFVLMVLGTVFMVIGYRFMGDESLLVEANVKAFRFFTVDSNVLMGVICLLYAVCEISVLTGKHERIPTWLSVAKLIGTTGVALTMVTVVVFLAPLVTASGNPLGYWALFLNTNLFFHLVIPLAAIVVFVFCETTDRIRWRYTWLGMVPMGIYAIFYSFNALAHVEDGKVPVAYDWYHFMQGGLWMMAIVLPLMLGVTYLLSWLLWLASRKMDKVYNRPQP